MTPWRVPHTRQGLYSPGEFMATRRVTPGTPDWRLSVNWPVEGARTLAEAATRLREYASDLEAMEAEGGQLAEPVYQGWIDITPSSAAHWARAFTRYGARLSPVTRLVLHAIARDYQGVPVTTAELAAVCGPPRDGFPGLTPADVQAHIETGIASGWIGRAGKDSYFLRFPGRPL
jgi:hypothetical protein